MKKVTKKKHIYRNEMEDSGNNHIKEEVATQEKSIGKNMNHLKPKGKKRVNELNL